MAQKTGVASSRRALARVYGGGVEGYIVTGVSVDYTKMKAVELEECFNRAVDARDDASIEGVYAELRRRARVGRAGSAAAEVLRRVAAMRRPRTSVSCASCASGSCPGGHVYVLAISWKGALIHYVGYTGKRVEERLDDNFRHNDAGRWIRTGKAADFIRSAGRDNVRIATELFASVNPVASARDTEKLKAAEGVLARKLSDDGLQTYSDQLPKSLRAKFWSGDRES